jgi:hypothetical protein
MIKVGSLCWIKYSNYYPMWVGRVVEVTDVLGDHPCIDPVGVLVAGQTYLAKAEWMPWDRAAFSSDQLIPFSDPTDYTNDRYQEPRAPVIDAEFQPVLPMIEVPALDA